MDSDPENYAYSKHAAERCQQRGISEKAVNALISYGKPDYVRDGISYSMDQRSRKKVRDGLGAAKCRELERWMNCYVVVSLYDNIVITVAHRRRRRRNW